MNVSSGAIGLICQLYYLSSNGRAKPLEEILRILACVLTATVAFGIGVAEAAWSEHPYKDLGFVVEFPNPPSASTGNYKSVLVDAAPVHIFSQKQDNALFIASVTDLQSQAGEGASLM